MLPPLSPSLVGNVAVASACALATFTDVRWRRVPNWLTGALALLAVGLRGVEGWSALGMGLLAMLLVLALGLPFFAVGWFGGGDVKLMAAVAAVIGFPAALPFLLATLLWGGVIALGFAVASRQLGNAFVGVRRMFTLAVYARMAVATPTTEVKVPYALAVAAGFISILILGYGTHL